ncbi:MAG: hypothetical protein NTV09_07195 [Bacteroidetes bacterium]|nr:hypothetical protein [Bacteroidota bacterium]
MQEENNDIDNFFRDNLEKIEAAPPERVWASIAVELDKKKKSRGLWLFGVLLLAGIISIGSYEYLKQDAETANRNNSKQFKSISESGIMKAENKKTIASVSNSLSNSGIESEKKVAAQAINPEVTQQKTLVHSNELKHKTAEHNIAFNPSPAVSVSDISQGVQTKSGAKKPVNTISTSVIENTVIALPGKDEITDKKISQPSQNTATETSKVAVESNAPQSKDGNFGEKQSAPVVQSNPTEKSVPTSKFEEVVSEKAVSKSVIENPERKDATTPVVASVAEVPVAEKSEPPAEPIKTNLLKRIGSHTTLGLYYSPDYTDERMSGTRYASHTVHGYSWNSGLKLGYEIGTKWSISSGVSYSEFSKSDTYSYINVASDSAYFYSHHGDGDDDDEGDDHEGGPAHNGNHYVLHTDYGDYDLTELPEESTGEEESGDVVTQASVVVSSMASINIPLKVRYNLRSKRFGYYMEAGGLMNHIVSSNSNINIGNHIESGHVKGLKKNYYSALLNLGIEYHFYKGLTLFLEPNLRYSITPLLESGSEKSYPYFIGCNLGVSIHF